MMVGAEALSGPSLTWRLAVGFLVEGSVVRRQPVFNLRAQLGIGVIQDRCEPGRIAIGS